MIDDTVVRVVEKEKDHKRGAEEVGNGNWDL